MVSMKCHIWLKGLINMKSKLFVMALAPAVVLTLGIWVTSFAQDTAPAPEKRISLEWKDAPIGTAIQQILRGTSINYLFEPGVNQSTLVTLSIKDMAVPDALKFVARSAGLEARLSENAWTIGPKPDTTSTAATPIVPEAPAGLKPEPLRELARDPDPKVAGQAGYLLALLGEREGLEPLLRLWREGGEGHDGTRRLVYRAIAALDDGEQLPVLKAIYAKLESYEYSEFYWTIRIMTGPAVLEFRKQIRDEVGVSNLR